MEISVSSASGIEAVTKRELNNILGKEDLSAVGGRIVFDGGWKEIAQCNLLLRTANRVGIVVGKFKADTFDDLFDAVSQIAWEEFLPANARVIVSAKSTSCKLFAYSSIQSISQKAIYERLKTKYKIDRLPESGARYKIEFAGFNDFFTATIDTSGDGLHRRGYRGLVGEAPLKETVASALIQLSVWNKTRPLADVFCGSGTIPIEATLIALNIPSGINRTFDFLNWDCVDKKIFDDVKQKALSEVDYSQELHIMGFDIDDNQLRLARKHATLAGVDKYIHFQRADMRDFSSRFSHGVIISNPPYGERLMTRREIEILYRDYGKMYNSLDDWCAYTLTSVSDFERLFGKKADKKRKLYNGKLECTYFSILGTAPTKKAVGIKEAK